MDLGTIAKTLGCLFGRKITLRLPHELKPVETVQNNHFMKGNATYPTRNFLTLALRKRGG